VFAAALDLEAALREQHPRITAVDIFHFWTSFDVWVDLAVFCRKTLWNGHEDELRIEAALRRFSRFLGSYAHSIRFEGGCRLIEHSTTQDGAFSTNGSGDPGLSDASQQDANPRLATGALHGQERVSAAESSELLASQNASSRGVNSGRRRGRRPNRERTEALRNAIRNQGEHWRDHLDEIFKELDSKEVPLGDFHGMKLDLDDSPPRRSGNGTIWNAQILDTLRKYSD
jgi:hypothetical protein